MPEKSTASSQFIVVWTKKTSGGNLPILFHSTPYVPVRLPCHYIVLDAADKYAESTLGLIARTLKALYEYFRAVDIDLDELLARGDLLKVNEIVGFARWLRNGRRAPTGLINRIGIATKDDKIILRSTVNHYLYVTKHFLVWAAQTYCPLTEHEKLLATTFEETRGKLNRVFSRFSRPSTDRSSKGLTKEQMDRLRLAAQPESPTNPFKDKAVKYRNWCIVEILYATGLRRGELLSAYSCDKPSIHNNHKWAVRRRPADPRDPRNPRPAVKTKERDIQLLSSHSDLLKHYIDKYRYVYTKDANGRVKKRRPPHDFLFVSTDDGAPLSLDVINKMLSTLAEAALPNEAFHLHPHLLRNTYCNEFMEQAVNIDGRPIDSAKDELRRLCGWSIRSTMPSVYAEKWEEESADKAQRSRLLRLEDEKQTKNGR